MKKCDCFYALLGYEYDNDYNVRFDRASYFDSVDPFLRNCTYTDMVHCANPIVRDYMHGGDNELEEVCPPQAGFKIDAIQLESEYLSV